MFRSGKKITINYLQEYNHRLKRSEPETQEFSAQYHLEISNAQELRTELAQERNKILDKIQAYPEIGLFNDVICAADIYGRMV